MFTNVSEVLAASIIRAMIIALIIAINVGKLLPHYTTLQPRRLPSSYSPP
jgi:hypothetical protein